MPNACLLDNDVVLKVAAYRLNSLILDLLTVAGEAPAMLGVGRFVVRQKASRKTRFRNSKAVTASVEDLLDQLQVIEPTDEEINLAAGLETSALYANGAFDTGEAQLLAVLITRVLPAFVSGDKRAIKAIADLDVAQAHGRIICLEQIIARLAHSCPIGTLRNHVCAEPSADRALSFCFACASLGSVELDTNAAIEALQSYVNDLRQQSGDVLMADESVSALTA